MVSQRPGKPTVGTVMISNIRTVSGTVTSKVKGSVTCSVVDFRRDSVIVLEVFGSGVVTVSV